MHQDKALVLVPQELPFSLTFTFGSSPHCILSGWTSKAVCKSRAETGLNLLRLLAASPGLKGPHVLSERPVEWEATVETTGSPMCFHSCAECYPFNQLLSDNSWVPGLQLAACKLCCATVSAGQMCLDITVPEYIFSECSWAVFWRAAQHASRFRSNKREKWDASALTQLI